MCVNGKTVFLKRKESGPQIPSTGLDSSFSMCSVALSKFLSLSALCRLQLQNGTNPMPITWLKPPCNTGLCKAESCEKGIDLSASGGRAPASRSRVILRQSETERASSTPCSYRRLNMSFPLKKGESSFCRGVIIHLVLGEPVN